MCFTNFLQSKKKSFQELLDEFLNKKNDKIRLFKDQLKKILSDLIPLQMESIINLEKELEYKQQVLEKTSELVQQITRLNEQIAFIESLIKKLALSPVEITGDEQTFLIRLFLSSKLSVPDSMVSILDEYLKNIGLMSNTILLSLYRYIRVHFWLQHFVVRVYLFQKGQERKFYEKTYPNFISFNVKSEEKGEYNKIMEERIHEAKKQSIQYRDTFQSMISALEFEKLKLDFLECSAQFAKRISGFSSIDEFIFDGEKDLDSLNSLFASLLVIESKFISEKEKFMEFDRKFRTFLKETKDTLQSIFDMNEDSETTSLADSTQCWINRCEYKQPFADIRDLIETTKSVLFKKCYEDCDCKTRTSSYDYRPQQIVHKLIVLTPEMELKIDQCSAKLPKFLE